ncbi:MAG: hypothetical protein SOX17_09455 [Prevotella sp.]|nr:hypothetical protein [Prevotella sp.]MDD7605515.1 hypothetical protein [Prevotellaceae bacterium]MDY3248705.1 hypothetical protein [Prevotella sp.]
MARKNNKVNCDEEPVAYCPRCYSLNIVHEDTIDADCCGKCGCSDIKTASIGEWEKLYMMRYGHKFVSDNRNIKESLIYNAPISKLKKAVYNSIGWKTTCMALYPGFPEYLSKADSIILLFSKLIDDNRMEELRRYLANQYKNSKRYLVL